MNREIAALDRMLALAGESIVLMRQFGTTPNSFVSVECLAFVRGYRPEELIGSISQTDSFVVISPTEINRANGRAVPACYLSRMPASPVKGTRS